MFRSYELADSVADGFPGVTLAPLPFSAEGAEDGEDDDAAGVELAGALSEVLAEEEAGADGADGPVETQY